MAAPANKGMTVHKSNPIPSSFFLYIHDILLQATYVMRLLGTALCSADVGWDFSGSLCMPCLACTLPSSSLV